MTLTERMDNITKLTDELKQQLIPEDLAIVRDLQIAIRKLRDRRGDIFTASIILTEFETIEQLIPTAKMPF